MGSVQVFQNMPAGRKLRADFGCKIEWQSDLVSNCSEPIRASAWHCTMSTGNSAQIFRTTGSQGSSALQHNGLLCLIINTGHRKLNYCGVTKGKGTVFGHSDSTQASKWSAIDPFHGRHVDRSKQEMHRGANNEIIHSLLSATVNHVPCLNGMLPPLMLLIPPVPFFLLWQVKMSAVTRANYHLKANGGCMLH